MFSSWSINKPHFYSAVPQGYFLLLWFHNAVLSCALMLIWKFDALHAWFSPITAQGQNKAFSFTFPFDLAPQLFLCSPSLPSTSWFFSISLYFAFFLFSCVKNQKSQAYCIFASITLARYFQISKEATERLHEKFTLDWPFRCQEL